MIEKLSELRNLTRFFAIRENALRKKRKMKCALFDTRVFVQKRCSGSTIFLHLSATSQVVGHHRGRVKGKKEKWKKGARTGMQIFDWNRHPPFDGMVYTARRNAPMRVYSYTDPTYFHILHSVDNAWMVFLQYTPRCNRSWLSSRTR